MYDYNEELIKIKGKINWFDIVRSMIFYGVGYFFIFNIDDGFIGEHRLISSIIMFILPIAIVMLDKAIQTSDGSTIRFMKKKEIDKLKSEGKYFGATFEDELIRFTGFVRLESRNGTSYKGESFSEILIYYSEIIEIYIRKEHVKIYYSKGKVVYNFNVSHYFNNSIHLANEIKSRTNGEDCKINFNFK